MNFKHAKPFLVELMLFIVIVICVYTALTNSLNMIKIIFNCSRYVAIAVQIFMLVVLSMFSRIINLGSRVLLDMVCRHVKEDEYAFVKEISFEVELLQKVDRDGCRSATKFYNVIVSKDNINYTFISSVSLGLVKDNVYKIQTGKFSNVIIQTEDLLYIN